MKTVLVVDEDGQKNLKEVLAANDFKVTEPGMSREDDPVADTVTETPAKLTFKESSAVVALRLITAQLIFVLLYIFIVGTISFISSYLGIVNPFPLYIALMIVMLVFNLATIFFIILKWNSEYTVVEKGGIIKRSGILHKKEQKYACNFVESIILDQGFLGMILDYGTIELYDPALTERVCLTNIQSPKNNGELIEKVTSKNHDHQRTMPFMANHSIESTAA